MRHLTERGFSWLVTVRWRGRRFTNIMTFSTLHFGTQNILLSVYIKDSFYFCYPSTLSLTFIPSLRFGRPFGTKLDFSSVLLCMFCHRSVVQHLTKWPASNTNYWRSNVLLRTIYAVKVPHYVPICIQWKSAMRWSQWVSDFNCFVTTIILGNSLVRKGTLQCLQVNKSVKREV